MLLVKLLFLISRISALNYDIAIVGGGATGMIQMHFLMKQHPNLNIVLIEKQNRIGGRTFSSNISYNNINSTAESSITIEGGAYATNYNHLLWQILFYLDLCNDLIALNSTSPSDPIYYFRRQYQYDTVAWNKFYSFTLMDNEYVNNNPNPFNLTYSMVLSENNHGLPPQNESQWMNFFTNWTLNGTHLYKYSLRSVLRTLLNSSIEFDQYRTDTEFGWDREANLAHYLWYNYGNSDHVNGAYWLRNGYQSIINTFYNKTEFNQNHTLWLNAALTGIDYGNDIKYRYQMKIKNGTELISINVSKIILSIDPMNLNQILADLKPIYNDYTKHVFDIFKPVHLYKINLIYNSDFWINENLIALSQSRTNLEINEISIKKIWTNGTLTTIQIYAASTEKSNFWNELQVLGEPYRTAKDIMFDTSLIIASNVVVEYAVQQISILTQKEIPLPLAAFVYPWGQNKTYYDGMNNFRFNIANLIQIINDMNQPNKNEQIYIAASDYTMNMSYFQYTAYRTGLNNIIQNFNAVNPFGNNEPQCPFPNKWP